MSKNPTTKRWDDEISFGDDDAPAAPAPAPAPTPAPAAQPPVAAARELPPELAALRGKAQVTLGELIAVIAATTTPEACTATARAIVRSTPIGGLHEQDPVRVELRAAYQLRLLLVTCATVWRTLWATLAEGVRQQQIAAQVAAQAATAPAVAAPEPSGLSIEQALTAVQGDAATGATGGSIRGGEMGAAGYRSADGYVGALARGVKQATGQQYLQVLRSSYGFTDEQIAGLTIAPWLDAPTGKPSGAGVVVDARVEVDGKKVDGIQLARMQRKAAADKIRATADAATLALSQQLIAKEDSPTAVWTIGWRGAGSLTRGEIEAAVGEAPEGKARSTQLARAVETLKGKWDYTKVASGVPAHVTVRWQIGRGEQHAAEVGEAYGEVKAIIDLVDGKIEGTGSTDIIDHVREEYQRRVDEEVLQPADITRWLQTEILPRYGAVEDGHDYLVPPQHRVAARAWFNRFAAVWPTASWKRGGLQTEPDGTPRIVNGRPVPELGRLIDDVASVLGGVFVGLEGEIDEQEKLWARTVAEAAKKNPDGLVGSRACATALERLEGEKAGEGLIAKLETSRALLGDGPVKVLLDRARALRKAVAEAAAANDPTAQRFANLEIGR